MNNPPVHLFNFDVLLLGGVILLLMLIFHAVYNYFVTNTYQNTSRKLIQSQNYRYTLFLFYAMSFVLVGSHLIEIYLWGVALFYFSLVPNLDQAIFFAGSFYTTVGYGSIPLPSGWDLMVVIIALNGMVAFGWTIANLANMQRTVHVARRLAKSDGYFM
ncbi:potassium channel family protein [Polynucleobacter sp. MWH-Svant-W18]|uniref:potassium channel family protein n=1 Tax=Polynucleobacter sp. MWH-Svant-W18 TaxID=1855909 RepID=UPI001BFD80BF|nr:potassium channel family protein [Polynucleobacter sp. MWH-Svant-W18]QWD77617.1 two pore domain potassium channel family protein [Polynucleobacter sp. MWH-Svant-W18]